MKWNKIVIVFLSLCLCIPAKADIVLPDLIGDYMLLQQQTEVKLWGKATAGNLVSVYTSWGASAETRVDKQGQWEVQISTPSASYQEHTITFVETPRQRAYYNPEPIQVAHVLIGEVWLASGQSNMEMPLRGFWQCPVQHANEEIALARRFSGKIRYATIERRDALQPQGEAFGKWQDCNPFNAVQFGATAFFFAQWLQQALDIPVGIINCSWGGSSLEGWMPRQMVEKYEDIPSTDAEIEAIPTVWQRPIVMYNGMLYPIRRYTIKGFLWYQGCSNVGKDATYPYREAEMVTHWRSLFSNGTKNKVLPFYFVEIAPYGYGAPMAHNAADLRASQWRLTDLIPETEGVCTNDLVEPYEIDNIHPKNKQEIGKRLAFLALHRDYGMQHVECYSPRLERVETTDSTLVLFFSHAEDGFSRYADIQGFELSPDGENWFPALATAHPDHKNAMVLCYASQVRPMPIQTVQYAYHNFSIGNLASMRYLPVVPFRYMLPKPISTRQAPFIGTNFWYAPILASTGEGGDRERLKRELDTLQSLGVNNLRILVGGEGERGMTAHIRPTLQPQAGIYNDTLLDGLDYLLADLEQRGMQAVLYLNNAWEWSGGYAQYVSWATGTYMPIPAIDGWDTYKQYAKQFITMPDAQQLFDNHLRFLLTRTNRYTHRPYTESPAIYAWQIANEPRAFAETGTPADEQQKQRFVQWIDHCSRLIHALDPNHRITTGSEGLWGCEKDSALFCAIHSLPCIDYATCHIWPYNWGWLQAGNHLDSVEHYLQTHIRWMEQIGKPLVIEEFGLPRDGMSLQAGSPTVLRNEMYAHIFNAVHQSHQAGKPLIGCNFWGWGGEGGTYTGDPAQEPQGLNSVFTADTTTLQLIRTYSCTLDN